MLLQAACLHALCGLVSQAQAVQCAAQHCIRGSHQSSRVLLCHGWVVLWAGCQVEEIVMGRWLEETWWLLEVEAGCFAACMVLHVLHVLVHSGCLRLQGGG